MKHLWKPVILPGLMAMTMVLSGCAGSLMVNERTFGPGGPHYVKESANRGQMETIVHGSIFGSDEATMSHRVTHAMPGTYMGPEMEFTPKPDSNPMAIRAVFLMNPPRGISPKVICEDVGSVQLGDHTDSLRISGGLCKGKQLIRLATARGPVPNSLEDPMFTSYIAAITSHLLSPRNTDLGDCSSSSCSNS